MVLPPTRAAVTGLIVQTAGKIAIARDIASMTRKDDNTMIGYVGPIEKQTLENTYFRKVLFTGKHSPLCQHV